jgi:splicing factor 3A subunit 3
MGRNNSIFIRLSEFLSTERAATKENIERKQARTAGEEEDDDEVEQVYDVDEVDESAPYNPKNLPLGWDGKPSMNYFQKRH